MAKVFIPFQLRKFTNGTPEVDVPAATLRELIDELENLYPGIKDRLVKDDKLKPGLSAIVGYVATRQGLRQKLDPDVVVHFLSRIHI